MTMTGSETIDAVSFLKQLRAIVAQATDEGTNTDRIVYQVVGAVQAEIANALGVRSGEIDLLEYPKARDEFSAIKRRYTGTY